MGKLIAIGGGFNGGEFDIEIEKQIRNFLVDQSPKVVFIPYASTNFEDNYGQFTSMYESMGCKVKLLQPGQESCLLSADLIYLGRGCTIPLMQKLIETNGKHFLSEAIKNGCIVAGFSAGANALFTLAGSQEQIIGFTLVEGLGLIDGCITTHYNYKDRADAFHSLLQQNNLTAIGLEDHTMLVFENGTGKVYSTKADANGYVIHPRNSNGFAISTIDKEIKSPFNKMESGIS